MADILFGFALLLLVSIGGGLLRVYRGPGRADRMMGAQLIGTGGIALVLLLAAATGSRTGEAWDVGAMVDVALVLALFAAFAAIAFVKSATGTRDPEAPAIDAEEEP